MAETLRARRRDWGPPLFLLGLALVIFWPALWGMIHLETDFLHWVYPWRQQRVGPDSGACVSLANNLLQDPLLIYAPQDGLFNEMLKKGELLLWDPYQCGGHPLQAVGHPSMVYPPRLLLHWLLPPLTAREALLFLHLYLGGLFAYYYLRNMDLSRFASTLGGTVWMLGGYAAVSLEFEFVTAACAHVPLALLLVERTARARTLAAAAALALALGSLILVGHWQYVVYALLLIGGYAACRAASEGIRVGLLLAAAAVLGVALSAVQLLPSLELFAQSQRPAMTPDTLFASARFLPENLLTLLLPDALGTPRHHFYLTRLKSGVQTYMDLCGYVGVLPLALAIMGCVAAPRRARFLQAAALLALLYAMGVPGVTWLCYVLPGFKNFAPIRTILIYSSCMALLAAFGMQAFEDGRVGLRALRLALLAWLAVTVALVAFCARMGHDEGFVQALVLRYVPGGLLERPPYVARSVDFVQQRALEVRDHFTMADPYLWVPLALGWAGLGLLYLSRLGRLSRPWFRVLFLLAVSVDLLYFTARFSVPFPRASAFPDAPALHVLAGAREGPYRVAGLVRGIHPNLLTAYRIQDVAGYGSLFPTRYLELVGALSRHKQSYLMADLWDGLGYRPGMADLLGVRYHYTDPLHQLPRSLGRPIHGGDLNVYQNDTALPRCFLVPTARVEKDPRRVLQAMLADDFDPRRAVYLEEEAPSTDAAATGRTLDMDYQPNRVRLTVEASRACWMVCADAWYPGWEARVDGAPTRLYRADYCFRAIRVERGVHHVEMAFRPRSFLVGRAISLGAALLCLGLLWRRPTA